MTAVPNKLELLQSNLAVHGRDLAPINARCGRESFGGYCLGQLHHIHWSSHEAEVPDGGSRCC